MTKPLSEYNFFDPAVIENPFEFYQAAREQAPVYLLPGTKPPIYLVTSFDLISEALKDPYTFSNNFSAALQGRAAYDEDVKKVISRGWPQVDTLLTNDPPSHTRFRKLVNTAFTPGKVNRLEDYVADFVNELIDGIIDRGECEFITDFAVKLPVTVIADQLGVPRSDQALFKTWSDAFVARLGGMASKEEELEAAQHIVDFQHYMIEKANERRKDPKQDILSDLVHAQVDDERPLDEAELLSILQQLLVAGNETTTNTLAGGLLLLIQNPDQMTRVRQDPTLIKNMVEEILRLESPTSGMWRVVKKAGELGGVPIPAGSMLHLRYAAANRDETKFADAEAFDPGRKNAGIHLAFGRGTHMCVGAVLAKKEMTVAFTHLLRRLDNIRLAEGRNDLTHFPNVLLRGLKALHIEFDRAA